MWQNDRVEIIANDQGNRTTPSYVAFNETERLIGDAAKNQVAMNAFNTVFDAKRLIGRKFTDSAVQSDMKHWPFKVRISVLRCFHAIDATRVYQTRPWVVLYSNLSEFGRDSREMLRAGHVRRRRQAHDPRAI